MLFEVHYHIPFIYWISKGNLLAHRRPHSYDVLHRDVTPFRIVIQPDAQESDRGVLLDFEPALEIDSPTPRAGEAVSYNYKVPLPLY